MAKRERVETDTVCDRCGRLCKHEASEVQGADEVPFFGFGLVDQIPDLCKGCMQSLVKWWRRGSREEAA